MIIVKLDISLPEMCPRCPFYRGTIWGDAGHCLLKELTDGYERCVSYYDRDENCPLEKAEQDENK